MRRKNHTHQQDIDDLKRQNALLEQQGISHRPTVMFCRLGVLDANLKLIRTWFKNREHLNQLVEVVGICLFLPADISGDSCDLLRKVLSLTQSNLTYSRTRHTTCFSTVSDLAGCCREIKHHVEEYNMMYCSQNQTDSATETAQAWTPEVNLHLRV